ncbi:ATP-binding cassette domain-containing protein [Hathewaya histolytica]|uniref:ATP-binding cassette domain-containing protein n=1 Tax=Hathewaya histolytica TaxID=1498 RepID=UPI003B67EA05
MPKLTVNDVNYSYKDKKVLHDINFQVNNGLVGILGHNGAGKTTLIKLLNTLFNVQKGKITLDDLDYKTNISNIRKGIGYLPQNFYTSLSLIIISSYYLIEEHLWRCKIFRERGILSHIYYYYDQNISVHMNYKLIYLVLSVILLITSIKLTNKSN